MVAWKMQRLFSPMRLTMVHSYSKKMLESGDNQIKKKGRNVGTAILDPLKYILVLVLRARALSLSLSLALSLSRSLSLSHRMRYMR
jgi:hypothetical protein